VREDDKDGDEDVGLMRMTGMISWMCDVSAWQQKGRGMFSLHII